MQKSILTLIFILLCITNLALAAENRYALVIGNAAYPTAPLENPVNDATDMAAKLKQRGFTVTRLVDANQQRMEQAIKSFTNKLTGTNSVGIFYYAGHGLEVEGENYIVPVDAELSDEEDVKYKTVNMGQVLDRMNQAGNGLNLVILDACRNNPFKQRGWRSFQKVGLAQMKPATGTLIMYAAEPGKEAQDGNGRNGTFTKYLLAALDVPGVEVESAFKEVSAQVSAETGEKQKPWYEGVIHGHFMFIPGNSTSTASAATFTEELARCQQYLQANRLLTGNNGNAFSCYVSILQRDPTNIAAKTGLQAIVYRYQDLAKDANKRRQSSQAQDFLAKAEIVQSYINGLPPLPPPPPRTWIEWLLQKIDLLLQTSNLLNSLATLLVIIGTIWWRYFRRNFPAARVIALSSPHGRVYRLKKISTELGRKEWVNWWEGIRINDDSVSRHHARIEYRKTSTPGFYLIDDVPSKENKKGSTNGTRLNNQEVPQGDHTGVILKHGDIFTLANLPFGFVIDKEDKAEQRAKRAGSAIETAVAKKTAVAKVDPNLTK